MQTKKPLFIVIGVLVTILFVTVVPKYISNRYGNSSKHEGAYLKSEARSTNGSNKNDLSNAAENKVSTPPTANLPWGEAIALPQSEIKRMQTNVPLGSTGLPRTATPRNVPKATVSVDRAHVGKAALTTQAAISESSNTIAYGIPKPPKFILSMCRDLRGNLWVGAEDNQSGSGGVWQYDIAAAQWKRYTVKDGLGDDNGYALACDTVGRIWVGHLNHGVSVYDGERWQCYEVIGGLSRPSTLSGPIGERVFAIAISPYDGDVWIGTNRGISRYSEKSSRWIYYNRFNGLPSNSVTAISFDQSGVVFCGTDCDGIAIADPSTQYQEWRHCRPVTTLSPEPSGVGLVSDMINALLVTTDGTVYAGTPCGLAWSRDRGASWQYVRGADYSDKIRGSSAGAYKGWQARQQRTLLEDYVTTIAAGTDGKSVLVGHREKPLEFAVIDKDKLIDSGELRSELYQTAIVVDPASMSYVVGSYDKAGIAVNRLSAVNGASPLTSQIRPKLPEAAKSASANPNARKTLDASDASFQISTNTLGVERLDDDWRTQGDWLGRYGRYWACLSSMSGTDYIWGSGKTSIAYRAFIGPNRSAQDSIRYYIANLYVSDRRILELPPIYLDSRIKKGLTTQAQTRRESQNDDHGEAYPATHEGPDLYYDIAIPKGLFLLSLYQVNQWGQKPAERNRDYRISIREGPTFKSGNDAGIDLKFESKPELARARVSQFYGGVYKRFRVVGPRMLTVKIAKQASLNTINSAIMLDTFDEFPEPYPIESQMADSTLYKSMKKDIAPIQAPAHPVSDGNISGRDRYMDLSVPLSNWEAPPAIERLRQILGEKTTATEASKMMLLRSASCDYLSIQAFEAAEKCQRQNGQIPIRDIEKKLTWDGKRPQYSGHGRQAVIDYVKANTSSVERTK